MKLFLAPMEGVTDDAFREIITSLPAAPSSDPEKPAIPSLDFCVSEFIRVTTSLHPKKVFHRFVPELMTGGKTSSGTPVLVQLLGGQPAPLADNAARLAEMGALGIDLNFGCPAKTVNRHDGGAALLKCPDRLLEISRAVRKAVPANISVSAKIRLGFSDQSNLFENVKALEEGGVSWITVHCRTKEQGYRPPAHWEWIPRIKEISKTPLVVNGDIFTVEDFLKCREVTGGEAFMIGRGALKNPFLFQQIRETLENEKFKEHSWVQIQQLVIDLHSRSTNKINLAFAAARTKQWLRYLSLDSDKARLLFNESKTLKTQSFALKIRETISDELVLSKSLGAEKINNDVRINHYF